ncbi:unnamed protein product [Fraxinus pennsylvanica]|uniref:Elongation factor 1-gamma n=1 Tax=Fraxinus pennsylvanica TaxID=56036 RepID=A0AAD2ECN1_9LAMI|nr:unnamed protein product [Fraxinus pennsylvanica]
MALVLHASSTNKNGYKALIAAEYSDVKIELVKNFEMGVSNKTPEFLKMNPIGKVPVLETSDGPLFESNAIARYVTRLKADNPLYGTSLIDYGRIEQWIDFATAEIDVNIGRWLYPRFGLTVYLPPAEEAAIAALKRALGALNTHLTSNTYLVGHGITLADIIMTCNLSIGFKAIMTKSFTSEFPHVERYFWTMVNQPKFHKILGDLKQAESIPPVASKKPAQTKESAKPKPKDEPKEEAKKEVKPKERMDLARKYAFGKMLIIGSEPPFKVKGLWLFRGKEIPQFVLDECYDMELYEWTKVDLNDEAQKERVSQMIEDAEPFEGEALLDAKCFK